MEENENNETSQVKSGPFNFGERIYLLYRVSLNLFATGLVLAYMTDARELGELTSYAGMLMFAVVAFVALKELVKGEVTTIRDLRTQLAINDLHFQIAEDEQRLNGLVIEEIKQQGDSR